MGKKYIIELEDKAFSQSGADGELLYRAKGFHSLVFDQNGLDKLTPADDLLTDAERGEAYNKGLDDAWNAVRYLWKYDDLMLHGWTATEMMERYRQRVGEEMDLHIGDELVWSNGGKSVVIDVDDHTFMDINPNGCVTAREKNGIGYHKTGGHFAELEKIMGAIRK